MTLKRLLLATLASWLAVSAAALAQGPGAPPVVPLWANGAPGFEAKKNDKENAKKKGDLEIGVTNVHNPSLTVYLPAKDKATGAAIIVCPGGGHNNLAIEHEGHNVGKWLADNGIAGFILKYRLAREKGSVYKIEEHAFQDAQRALRMVRHKAKDWNVNTGQLGIMGFSAGGDLVLYSSTKYDNGKADASDLVERESSRPNFQILLYPAIPKTLKFAKDNPPAFLVCGNQDRENISEGLATLYLNMKRAGINTELHIYASVGHGFGLRDRMNPARLAAWPARMKEWMSDNKLMNKK
ncbi:MAG TPA: alpha/beta hydrolase [Gemmataceae bacterium]|nr:alpha/beta hydrolase [Gemmataceae bacterium]